MAVPSERNFVTEKAENISKCNGLEIEIGKVWSTKTPIIFLAIGTLGSGKNRINR